MIHAERLDYFQSLEGERIHLLLLDDVKPALADVVKRRTFAADKALAERQQRRIAHRGGRCRTGA